MTRAARHHRQETEGRCNGGDGANMTETKPFYRVELADKHSGCSACGHNQMWTIVSGEGEDETQVHTSWGDREFVDNLCDLMNEAYEAGQENAADNAEEAKLVAFFRSPEGDALGRAGDHDNLSPAETAIRAMRASIAEDRPGRCDWCKQDASDLRPRRDPDEGRSGPVYYVCTPCMEKHQQELAEEAAEYYDDSDDWDDEFEPEQPF